MDQKQVRQVPAGKPVPGQEAQEAQVPAGKPVLDLAVPVGREDRAGHNNQNPPHRAVRFIPARPW